MPFLCLFINKDMRISIILLDIMETIQEQLKVIESYIFKQQVLIKEVLTIDEAATYLGLSRSALYKMTSKREIPFYVPGGKKIYFNRNELNDWIFKYRVSPDSDFVNGTDAYLSRTSKNLLS